MLGLHGSAFETRHAANHFQSNNRSGGTNVWTLGIAQQARYIVEHGFVDGMAREDHKVIAVIVAPRYCSQFPNLC